jgi:hypothetical protein
MAIKNKSILVILFLFYFISSRADEGMWVISDLDSSLVNRMSTMGLGINSDAIYSEAHPSIKDAIVMFDNGCTAEVVSENGLIFTNHHCGRDKVQEVSTEKNNYIRDGYWAHNASEEIPLKNLNVKFLVKSVDVTEQASAMLKNKTLRKVMSDIEKQYTDSINGFSASMDSYSDGRYIVSVYQVYNDVRLVGVPPECVGNFGGETDNFEWPRQSADFTVFRIYANGKNLPASYNSDNKPYQAKSFLPVSLKGVHDNDFQMTVGFPYTTQRYISSYELQDEQDVRFRATVLTKGKYIEVVKKCMDADESVRLKYSTKNFSAGNSYKFALGVSKLVKLSTAVSDKQKQEQALKTWISLDTSRIKKYGKCLGDLEDLFKKQQLSKYSHAIITGALFNDASLFGIRARNLAEQIEKKDKEQTEKAVSNYRQWYQNFIKDYDVNTDKAIVTAMIRIVLQEVPENNQPAIFETLKNKYKGDVNSFVNDVYAKSVFVNPAALEKFLDKPNLKIKNDLLYVFGTSVYDKLIELKKQFTDYGTSIKKAGQLFAEAQREKNKGLLRYPDANFSMRLTYGKVCGASPRDGLVYKSQTTIKGIIEKEDSSNFEFEVHPRLKQLYYKNDFGKYAENGTLYTCFLTNTDITGGNSGSPVINGKGELTGLAFDGNFESLAGSIIYEPEKNRSINVDIRYVLFVIDKFAGSDYIMKELTVRN